MSVGFEPQDNGLWLHKEKKSLHNRTEAPHLKVLNGTSFVLCRLSFCILQKHLMASYLAQLLLVTEFLSFSPSLIFILQPVSSSWINKYLVSAAWWTCSMNSHLQWPQDPLAAHNRKYILVSLFWLWVTLEMVYLKQLIGILITFPWD